MTKESAIQLFEQKQVPLVWKSEQVKWYSSIQKNHNHEQY
jgi:hypothetical protein